MSEEKLYFEHIREPRERYFVDYSPPIPTFRFSILQLTFTDHATKAEIAEFMQKEAVEWIHRFPIAVMVSAFDDTGTLIDLNTARPESHLMALPCNSEPNNVRLFWRRLKDEEIPHEAANPNSLLKIFATVPCRTSAQLKADSERNARQIRLGKLIILLWFGIGPIAILIVEFLSPEWLAAIVFCYGLWKGIVRALKLSGKWKKSPSELEQEKEDLMIRHHHYHCKQNPEGFLRLKIENFEREQREEIQREKDEVIEDATQLTR